MEKRINIKHHYFIYDMERHRIVGKWYPSMYRVSIGYTSFPVHRKYYSLTISTWVKKTEIKEAKLKLSEILDQELSKFHKDWVKWIPKYGFAVSVEGERVKLDPKLKGKVEVNFIELGKKLTTEPKT